MRGWVLVVVLASCGRIGFDDVGTASGDATLPGAPRLLIAGGPGDTFVDDVALDDGGKLVVIGNFDQTLSIAGDTLTSGASMLDVFVAAIAADDTKQWLWNGGCSVLCAAQGVKWLSSGVVGGGYLDGTLVNGGGATSGSGQDAMITWFGATGGTPVTSQYGGTQNVQIRGLDANASLVVAGGLYAGGLTFGVDTLPTSSTADNAFVAVFTTARNPLRAYSYNGAADVYVNDVALGPDGSMCVAGRNATTTNFGGGSSTVNGSGDGFVVRYDAQGNFVWATTTPGNGNEGTVNVAMAPNGDCIATGFYFSSQVGGTTTLPFAGVEDVFVVRHDAANGAVRWVRTVNGAGFDNANGIAVDGKDRIALLANFEGTATVAGRTVTSDGAGDAFVLLLDGAGDVLLLQQLGGAGGIIESGGGVSFDPAGTHVAVGFSFTGELTVKGTALRATAQAQDGAVFVMPVP